MRTFKKFITRLLHEIEALTLSTNISESWLHTWRWLLQFFLAESAGFGVILITSFSDVIRFVVAFSTEIFLTSVASDSIVRHVHSSFLGNKITLLVFLSLHNISWDELHDISALAADEIWV